MSAWLILESFDKSSMQTIILFSEQQQQKSSRIKKYCLSEAHVLLL